ncbi:MAG: TrkA family potassium uptake protein [Deltaproteobacteria bacterium]|nr:TrkA family potassium uptake protein [Deltaproteobacteria bacterium]
MKVIIVGQGKVVYFLARAFASRGRASVIIDPDPAECETLSRRLKALVLHGDGTRPEMLEVAGAREALALLAVTPRDQDNLVACQLAARIFGVPRTVALVNDPENREIFQKLGVGVPFSISHLMASLIEQQVGLEDIVNLEPVAEGKLLVSEVVLQVGQPGEGKSLEELNLPSGSLLGAILRQGEVVVPRGGDRLRAGDRLVLLSTPQSQGQALKMLVGKDL